MRAIALFCGSRKFPRERRPEVEQAVAALDASTLVIEGECRYGPDTWARKAAEDRGLHVLRVHALWKFHGRRAGPLRNGVMVELATVVYAYIAVEDPGGYDGGTADVIRRSRDAGVPLNITEALI